MFHLFSRQRVDARSKRRLAVGSGILLLVGMLVLTSVALFRPASHAHAATPHRMDTFTNNNGTVIHRWSDDDGATWSAWTSLPPLPDGLTAVGTPAAVSDGIALLTVAVRTSQGNLIYNTYNNGPWEGWTYFPGDVPSPSSGTWAVVTVNHWCACLPPLQQDGYQPSGSPALSSSGTGRMELFVYAVDGMGHTVLLHTWTDGGTWSGNWDSLGILGPYSMTGTPTAISWALGRTDVFTRGLNNDLEHLWFDNGQWASSWESLGTPTATIGLASSPAASSSTPGELNIFARGSDGHLWGDWYNNGGWGGWGDMGGGLAGDVTDSVAVTYVPGVSMDVFAAGTQHDLSRRSYNFSLGVWVNWQFLDNSLYFTNIAATTWVPVASDQPDPTPTPKVPCGGDNPCKQPQ